MKHAQKNGDRSFPRETSESWDSETMENLVGFFQLLHKVDQRLNGRTTGHKMLGKVLPDIPSAASSDCRHPRSSSPGKSGQLEFQNDPSSNPQGKKMLSKVLAIRVDPTTFERLQVVAHERGIGLTTLIRMWVMDHLSNEGNHPY